MKRINYLMIVLLALGTKVYGQEMQEDLFDLSLEELMNIEIVSASKKAESSFKSPLSSTVVTKDEIMASGATTIEEALRLVPGMLIREETNGNFDVHIRGNDNLPPGNFTFYTENSMSLIMIDGRPIYNYSVGGTFWEALPIGLIDVERIEVVRGPSTALYGPNAATGAINIITRDASEKSIAVEGNAQVGTKGTSIYNLSLGTSLAEDKLKVRVSGNLENRERDQETYYAYAYGEYVPGEDVPDYTSPTLDTSPTRFLTPKKAKERKGLNAFLNYQASEKVDINLSAGLQESYAQSAFNELTAAPLSGRSTESKYVDFNAQIHGLSAQVGYNTGTDDILVSNSNDSKFDFNILNTNIEYAFDLGKLNLRPGVNYQEAVYTDLPYGGQESTGYINAEQTLSNIGYFLRADFNPIEKLRLIAAVRNDHYNVPNADYLSYQFAGTYSFSDKHLLRAVYSKANRGPFMVDSYVNYTTGNGLTSPYIEYLGSENLDLPVINMFEVGYRGVLSSVVTVDVELFHTITNNVISFEPTFIGLDPSKGLNVIYEYLNLDLKSKQTGATFNLNIVPSSKVQLRAYATIQSTQLEDYDKKVTPIVIDPSTLTFELPQTERMDVEHQQTPNLYGGITGNFRPIDKFNLFTGIYFMSSHTYRHDFASADESKGQQVVPSRTVFNVKASYNVYKNSSIFINARNAFNSKGNEFGFADEIGGLYLAGINLSF